MQAWVCGIFIIVRVDRSLSEKKIINSKMADIPAKASLHAYSMAPVLPVSSKFIALLLSIMTSLKSQFLAVYNRIARRANDETARKQGKKTFPLFWFDVVIRKMAHGVIEM